MKNGWITLLLMIVPWIVQAKPVVEVAHWWTSEGESKAVAVLRDALRERGYDWQDFVIEGGGGGDHRKVLKARVAAGDPPTAVVTFMGPNVQKLGAEIGLTNLNEIALEENWAGILPPIINSMIQYKGNTVAVPINAHRSNWMWINTSVLKKANAKVPKSWDEFFEQAEKIQRAGLIPLALGGQPWQEATLFESVLLGVGGVELHKKIMIDLDPSGVIDPKLKTSFEVFKKTNKYIDKESPGRSWDLTTKLVINGQAAMQILGDWVKGEFFIHKKQLEVDFICHPAPGNQGIFVIDTDVFAMFSQKSAQLQQGQKIFAKMLMDPVVQEKFNLIKGSVPANLKTPPTKFDSCGRESMNSLRKDKVVPSFAFVQANSPEIHETLVQLISTFYHSEMTAEEATQSLGVILQTAK